MNINVGDLIGVKNYRSHNKIEFIVITEICTELNLTLTEYFQQQGFYCYHVNLTTQESNTVSTFVFYNQIIEL